MLPRLATQPTRENLGCAPHQLLRHDDGTPLQSPHSSDTGDVGIDEKQDAQTSGDGERDVRLRFSIDPEGSLTHDKTSVDVVAVPCPGGHPFRSWNREGLLSRCYGALSMRDAEAKEYPDRPSSSWVRQGIRRKADRARVLLYEHPELDEKTTLGGLADALLQDLQRLRDEEGQERPVLFIGHSVGGLVVKMALTKAGRDGRYVNILRECYGVAFFGEFESS